MKKTPKELAEELGVPLEPARDMPRRIIGMPNKNTQDNPVNDFLKSLPVPVPEKVCGECGKVKYKDDIFKKEDSLTQTCQNLRCPFEDTPIIYTQITL